MLSIDLSIISVIINAVLVPWSIVLTFLFLKQSKHYQQLTKKVKKKNLQTILIQILQEQKNQAQLISNIVNQVNNLEKEGMFHIQSIGFMRFNPFSDTGGDQSFIIALLDNNKNGIVISSLHSRDVTRVYAKLVKNGQGQEFDLSDEEKQVVDKAQQIGS